MNSPSSGQMEKEGYYYFQFLDIANNLIKYQHQVDSGLERLLEVRCQIDSIKRNFKASMNLKFQLEKLNIIANHMISQLKLTQGEQFECVRKSHASQSSHENQTLKSNGSLKKLRESVVLDEFLHPNFKMKRINLDYDSQVENYTREEKPKLLSHSSMYSSPPVNKIGLYKESKEEEKYVNSGSMRKPINLFPKPDKSKLSEAKKRLNNPVNPNEGSIDFRHRMSKPVGLRKRQSKPETVYMGSKKTEQTNRMFHVQTRYQGSDGLLPKSSSQAINDQIEVPENPPQARSQASQAMSTSSTRYRDIFSASKKRKPRKL